MQTLLQYFQPYFKRKKTIVTLYTDSQSVLDTLKDKSIYSVKPALKDHNDIIIHIKKCVQELRFDIVFEYVKAHKDGRQNLTSAEWLNIRMNDIANEYYDSDTSIPPSQRPIDFPDQQLTIRHQVSNVITNIKETFVKMEMNANIEDYYERKFAIYPDMINQIEWTALQKVFRRNKTTQHKMTKFIHRQYNTMCQAYK